MNENIIICVVNIIVKTEDTCAVDSPIVNFINNFLENVHLYKNKEHFYAEYRFIKHKKNQFFVI